jgi:hypothetical protein
MTRVQAERQLRERIESDTVVVSAGQRLSVAEAGERYVEHLEHVMDSHSE